jgi:hypothetical protein
MRTTLNIDDDVFGEVKQYAESRSVALGRAVSELIRRGLKYPLQTQLIDGIHVVVLPKNSPLVDTGQVKQLIEDELQ